jgi:hypothetical protein
MALDTPVNLVPITGMLNLQPREDVRRWSQPGRELINMQLDGPQGPLCLRQPPNVCGAAKRRDVPKGDITLGRFVTASNDYFPVCDAADRTAF